jgi:BolA protein
MNSTPQAPTAARLQQRLQAVLQPVSLEVIDESAQHHGHAGANGSGFGSHFRVRVTSHLFTGKTPVARHRLVYDALQDFMDQGLHALAIEAQAPVASSNGPKP